MCRFIQQHKFFENISYNCSFAYGINKNHHTSTVTKVSQNASVVLEIASENLPSNTYFFVIIASDDVDTAVVEGSFTVKGK